MSPDQVCACLVKVEGLLQKGKPAAATRTFRDLQAEPVDPAFARGLELWRGNRLRQAEQCLAEYSNSQPDDFRALLVRALISIRLGAIDEAIALIQQCLALQPGLMAPRPELVRLLIRRQRYGEASQHMDALLQSEPGNEEFLLLKAALLDRSGAYSEAIELLQEVIASQSSEGGNRPGQDARLAAHHTALAMIQRTIGDRQSAIDSLQRATRLDPQSGWPWFQLADLKVFEFQPSQVEQIRQGLEAAKPGSMNEVHFAFALGRALESIRDLNGAFSAYQRGNRTRAALAPFDMTALEREFSAIETLFSTPGMPTTAPAHSTDCPVIFIVGMPRSGTTLVEQIITAHSAVDGTMELPIMGTLVRELQQRQIKSGQVPYPAPGTQLAITELALMGEQYLQRAQVLRGSAPYFVDKMPFNFQHIGLMRKILPGCRIVNVRRHPMALGFSIYQQLFRFGQDWAFDLTQIAQYYLAYDSLMRFWESQAPGEIVHVQYEQLVASPEEAIRELLQALKLPEEEACFSPHKNSRPVRTASSEQVRQPVHSSAIDYWRQFARHLEPMRIALGSAGVDP